MIAINNHSFLIIVFAVPTSVKANIDYFPINPCCRGNVDIIDLKEDFEIFDAMERIPCSISAEEFQHNFEALRKPVVLQGCASLWKSSNRWSAENINNLVKNETMWRATLDDENDMADHINWLSIVEAREKNSFFYVFDNLDKPSGQVLVEDYDTPQMFRYDMFETLAFPPNDYGSMRWFTFGSKLSGTNPHVDPFYTDAWNTVVRGVKWWILFPLYEYEFLKHDMEMKCDPDCSLRTSVADFYSSILSDPWELYGQSSLQHIFVKEGETIYIPAGVPHR